MEETIKGKLHAWNNAARLEDVSMSWLKSCCRVLSRPDACFLLQLNVWAVLYLAVYALCEWSLQRAFLAGALWIHREMIQGRSQEVI